MTSCHCWTDFIVASSSRRSLSRRLALQRGFVANRPGFQQLSTKQCYLFQQIASRVLPHKVKPTQEALLDGDFCRDWQIKS
jgi:hypothetical protein